MANITTTLNTIRNSILDKVPLWEGLFNKLLYRLNKSAADNELIKFSTIANILGIDTTLVLLSYLEGHDNELCSLSCDIAELVQKDFQDPNILECISATKRFCGGMITKEELFDIMKVTLIEEVMPSDANPAEKARIFALWTSQNALLRRFRGIDTEILRSIVNDSSREEAKNEINKFLMELLIKYFG